MAVKFGPRKIGQAAFKLAQVTDVQGAKFGPRKFGARKAASRAVELAQAKAEAVAERQAKIDARAETAAEPVETPTAPETPKATEGTLSIKQIGEHLEENPTLYEDFYQRELVRPEGPRKGAMRIFLAIEEGKDEPNDVRIAEISRFLK